MHLTTFKIDHNAGDWAQVIELGRQSERISDNKPILLKHSIQNRTNNNYCVALNLRHTENRLRLWTDTIIFGSFYYVFAMITMSTHFSNFISCLVHIFVFFFFHLKNGHSPFLAFAHNRRVSILLILKAYG